MFIFAKNRAIREKIFAYLAVVDETLGHFEDAVNHYLAHGIDDHFATLVQRTHASESDADDLRWEIENDLYEKSLLPESREDLLHIIRAMDKLPNRAEQALRTIHLQDVTMPAELTGKVRELSTLAVETGRMCTKAMRQLLDRQGGVRDLVRAIDSNESVADGLENDAIYQLFHSDYDGAERILCRDVVNLLAALADTAEGVSEDLTIFAVKHVV